MAYLLDLKQISITDYKKNLKSKELYPTRRILLQDIDHNFSILIKNGINEVDALKKALSTPKKLGEFAEKTGISVEYLKILRREVGTMMQKPVRLKDIPDMDIGLLGILEGAGIKTTKDYFDFNCDAGGIVNTAKKIGISEDKAAEIIGLCKMCRINGVGPVASRIFFEAGYKTLSDVTDADARKMLDAVSAINDERKYYKGKLGENDMQFCIDDAALLRRFGAE